MIATPPRSCARWRACASAANRCGGGAGPWACPPSTGGGPGDHRQRRTPEARMGQLVQVDASPFAWLGARGPAMTVHGAIDDATNTVLALHFRPTEDLHGYAVVFQQLFTQYGLPLAFYGDRINIFVRNDAHWSLDEQLRGAQDPTHLGRILHDLGIGYIAAGSPEAKGRVERLWRTLQDRLTSELRLRHISTPEAANAFLPAFLRDFNRALPGPRPRRHPPGAAPRAISPSCSAVATRAGWPATTRSTSGRAGSSSRPAPTSAPTPAVASSSGNCSMAASSFCTRASCSPRSRRPPTSASRPTAPQVPTGATPRNGLPLRPRRFHVSARPRRRLRINAQTPRQALPLSQTRAPHAPRRATRGARPLPKRPRPFTPYRDDIFMLQLPRHFHVAATARAQIARLTRAASWKGASSCSPSVATHAPYRNSRLVRR